MYGMLGLSLMFVGITLISNGLCILMKVDAKSMSFMNLITGSVLVAVNLIYSAGMERTALNYTNVTAGLLFGFTYIFIAANLLMKLDLRPFGIYSLGVAVFALVMAVNSFISGETLFGCLWGAWMLLWFEGFLENVLKMSKLSKIFPYFAILEGVFAAGLPAIMFLLNIW